MCNERLNEIMVELKKPFPPSEISWKPGAVKGDRALALAYADLRAYMNRLDEVCGSDWSIEYEPWGDDRIICKLTICGVTRSSTGESNKESDRNEIGGTVAEAQAMKRACAFFSLGRYLYNLPSGWYDYDAASKRFTVAAKAKLTSMLVGHYREATGNKLASTAPVDNPFDEPDLLSGPHTSLLIAEFNTLGHELYGAQWETVCARNVQRISQGQTTVPNELSAEQIGKLIAGMTKLKLKGKVAA